MLLKKKGTLQMLKKASALLISAALLSGVTACYMPDNIFAEDLFDSEDEETVGDELSLYDFTFTLNDVEYELPMQYIVLSSRGWKLRGEEDSTAEDDGASDLAATETKTADETAEGEDIVYTPDTLIEPGAYSDYVPAERAGQSLGLKFYNDSKKSQKLADCLVVGVMAEIGSGDLSDFTLEGDITLGKTYEEVVTTYGRPSYTKDFVEETGELAAINDIAFIDDYDAESDDLTRVLYYSVDDTSVVSFELGDYGADDDAAVRITMDNQMEVEETYDYSKDLKTTPGIVRLYKGPNLLGKTFDNFAFKYETNLYTLPIPVRTLVNDGWVFVHGAADRVPSGTTADGVIMRKGNLAMSILVHNYDMKRAQTPINCYAVSLSASVVGPNVKILMAKGVTLGSDYSELVTAFGDEYAKLSGYVSEDEESEENEDGTETANQANTANTTAQETETELAVGTVETYELTEQEGCTIVKTVEEEYTVYSYIMPDDEPSITLPVSITDIKDPNTDLLGEHRKHIDVYLSNANGKILTIYLQNCPEYVVNEAEIIEQQMEAAEKAAQEAAEKGIDTAAAGTTAETTEASETSETAGGESSGKTPVKSNKTTMAVRQRFETFRSLKR